MIAWTTAAPAVSAAFLGSLVEAVEALTIVLAVATVRGWRAAGPGAGGGPGPARGPRFPRVDRARARSVPRSRSPGRSSARDRRAVAAFRHALAEQGNPARCGDHPAA